MRLLLLLELSAIVLGVALLVTQIVVPVLRHRPWFPIIRKSRVDGLKTDLADAREDTEAAKLEREVERIRERADRIRQTGQGGKSV